MIFAAATDLEAIGITLGSIIVVVASAYTGAMQAIAARNRKLAPKMDKRDQDIAEIRDTTQAVIEAVDQQPHGSKLIDLVKDLVGDLGDIREEFERARQRSTTENMVAEQRMKELADRVAELAMNVDQLGRSNEKIQAFLAGATVGRPDLFARDRDTEP